jgi:hypothetical protein
VVDLDFHLVDAVLDELHALGGLGAELRQREMAWRICDSTRPPSSITRAETWLSSLSNWVERCLSVMSVPCHVARRCRWRSQRKPPRRAGGVPSA